MKMENPKRMRLVGLVALLLAIVLFVPAEASTPCLTPATREQEIRPGCRSIGAASARWGTCNDINCCGGPPEAPCSPASI
jgi:hypothetical protein